MNAQAFQGRRFKQEKPEQMGPPEYLRRALCSQKQLNSPAVDTDAHAHPWRIKSDAATRTVIPVAIGAALDISLTRRITVRVPDNHAATAVSAITSPALIADHANRLHEV
jgi:hypothetical protein